MFIEILRQDVSLDHDAMATLNCGRQAPQRQAQTVWRTINTRNGARMAGAAHEARLRMLPPSRVEVELTRPLNVVIILSKV